MWRMRSVNEVRPGLRRSRLKSAGGLALLSPVRCDLIMGTDPPRVEFTNSGEEGPIVVITSGSFPVGAEAPEDIFFRQACSTGFDVLSEGTFSMHETQQSLVRIPPPENQDPHPTISVSIDVELSHTHEQVMDGDLLHFHFARL